MVGQRPHRRVSLICLLLRGNPVTIVNRRFDVARSNGEIISIGAVLSNVRGDNLYWTVEGFNGLLISDAQLSDLNDLYVYNVLQDSMKYPAKRYLLEWKKFLLMCNVVKACYDIMIIGWSAQMMEDILNRDYAIEYDSDRRAIDICCDIIIEVQDYSFVTYTYNKAPGSPDLLVSGKPEYWIEKMS